MTKKILKIVGLLIMMVCFWPGPSLAANNAVPKLTGQEKRFLLVIAREAVTAKLEARAPRRPQVDKRLMVPQGMVVSLYQDGKLIGRKWRLRQPLPLAEAAETITGETIEENSLTPEQLTGLTIKITVLSDYAKIADETELEPGRAVIVYSGFHEGLALPDGGQTGKGLLEAACQSVGLNPQTWLLPESALIAAHVEEAAESPGQ